MVTSEIQVLALLLFITVILLAVVLGVKMTDAYREYLKLGGIDDQLDWRENKMVAVLNPPYGKNPNQEKARLRFRRYQTIHWICTSILLILLGIGNFFLWF